MIIATIANYPVSHTFSVAQERASGSRKTFLCLTRAEDGPMSTGSHLACICGATFGNDYAGACDHAASIHPEHVRDYQASDEEPRS